MKIGVEQLVLRGEPEIEVQLRRSARARRMSLRVSRLDGRVTLSVPSTLRLDAARDFLEERADWVRGHLSRRPHALVPAPGVEIPVEGRVRLIELTPGRKMRLTPEQLLVAAGRPVAPQVAGLLKALARDRLTAACDRHAAAVSRPVTRISLRDTRSRWGSCTSQGNLMFSWRLAMAPPVVLDYVAAHEVAHLVEMNHSAAFWRVVAGLCPEFEAHRRWLRTEGADLHRISFSG